MQLQVTISPDLYCLTSHPRQVGGRVQVLGGGRGLLPRRHRALGRLHAPAAGRLALRRRHRRHHGAGLPRPLPRHRAHRPGGWGRGENNSAIKKIFVAQVLDLTRALVTEPHIITRTFYASPDPFSQDKVDTYNNIYNI